MDDENSGYSIETLTNNLVLKHKAYPRGLFVTSLFLSSLQNLAFQVHVQGDTSESLRFNDEPDLKTTTNATDDLGYKLRPSHSKYGIAVEVSSPSERDRTLFHPYGGKEDIIKEKALQLTSGTKSIADKVPKIFEYCAEIPCENAPPGFYSSGWNFSSATMIEKNLAPNSCKAIAQLFGELCQALSISTRLVGGLRKSDSGEDFNHEELPRGLFVDGFCGHRWAEYYDGKWMPIDPTLVVKPSEFNPSVYYRQIGEFLCPENISFYFLFPSGLVVPKPLLSRSKIPELVPLDNL